MEFRFWIDNDGTVTISDFHEDFIDLVKKLMNYEENNQK